MRVSWKSIPISIATLFCLAAPSYAMDVTLQWHASTEPDLAGYRIYYDTDPGPPYNGAGAEEGISPIDMPLAQDENADPNTVEYTVHDLLDGVHYFTVTAYNKEKLESRYSNEVNTNSPADSTSAFMSNSEELGGCFIRTGASGMSDTAPHTTAIQEVLVILLAFGFAIGGYRVIERKRGTGVQIGFSAGLETASNSPCLDRPSRIRGARQTLRPLSIL